MSTLLLRFAGPMQSWGMDKFERRGTSRIPTKSAVIGMIMASLGMRRDKQIPKELLDLRFGVRCDDEGVVIRDYHTVKKMKEDKTKTKVRRISSSEVMVDFEVTYNSQVATPYETTRYYLCDAVFLIGLEGDENYLKKVERALLSPVFPLFLGRKSCPPEGKLVLGIRQLPLEEALRQEEWLISDWRQKQKHKQIGDISLRISIDASENDDGYFVADMPISFDYKHRQYGVRKAMDLPSLVIKENNNFEHDAFATAKGG